MKEPKEKAKEILQKFTYELFFDGYDISKQMIKLCALICVDEMITWNGYEYSEYWQQVKTEIENL